MKLKTKIMALVLPLVVVPVMSLGIISYNYLRNTESERIIRQIQTALDQVESNFQNKRKTAEANVELFANHNIVIQYALTDNEETRYELIYNPLMVQFARFQKAFPDYYEIRYILPDGYEDARWTSAPITNVAENEANSVFFQHMSEQPEEIVSQILVNPDTHQLSLYTSKRLNLSDRSIDPYGKTPELKGYLVITSSLDSLAEQITSMRIGKSGEMLIADTNGRIYIQSVSSILADAGNEISDSISTLAERITSMPRDTGGFFTDTIKVKDAEVLLNSKMLSDNLFLVALLPKKELILDSRILADIVFIVTSIAILIAVILSFLSLHKLIIKPIRIVNEATHKVARGQLNEKIQVTTQDEIGDLARAFENMAETLKQSNEQISYLAYHDNLTGLPNRLMFNEYLSRSMADARRNQKMLALLFLDLDDFKRVNDSLGHHTGDQLLQKLAEKLSAGLREEDYLSKPVNAEDARDMVARLGGDEFVILLTNLHNGYDAASVAARILKTLEQPLNIGPNELYINTSIGITLFPNDADTSEALIKNADIAMYHAKEQGKNNYQFFSDAMNEAAQRRFSMENRLRKALQNEHFILHYQPQIDMRSGRLCGVEALIRWLDPDDGLIPPNEFIGIAEESGLILPITEWVLDTACRQNLAWQKQGLPAIPVSVNVSSIQLSRKDATDSIATALKQTGLAPALLDVELTESILLTAHNDSVETLNKLRQLGVSLSLDDFGTGYSSLSYLRHFPIQALKIDRSFIKEIMTNKVDAAIISSIIKMAHAMNLKVVAEGIETEEQYLLLQQFDCDVAQGFYFSRPVVAEEITRLLMERNILKTAKQESG